jgi:hypothetical protein
MSMSERSERIVSTGFGEALGAEPLTGGHLRERGWTGHPTLTVHQ